MAMSEQSILRPSPEVAAALAFAQGKRGAERRVLEYVADATLRGYEVNPRIQKIANALLAQSLLSGKLPAKAAGRHNKESTELKRVEDAYCYFEFLDKGMPRAAERAVERRKTENRYVDKRHVEYAARDYRSLIGLFREDRDRFRAWRSGITKDEYEASILVDLRMRNGRSVVGSTSIRDRQQKASDLVAALRQELIDFVNDSPIEPPFIVDEESEAG